MGTAGQLHRLLSRRSERRYLPLRQRRPLCPFAVTGTKENRSLR